MPCASHTCHTEVLLAGGLRHSGAVAERLTHRGMPSPYVLLGIHRPPSTIQFMNDRLLPLHFAIQALADGTARGSFVDLTVPLQLDAGFQLSEIPIRWR